MAEYVVAIHGVGEATPGALIGPLSKPLSESALDFNYERRTRLIDGAEYSLGESNKAPDVYEINWADVGRPSANIFSVVGHLFRLMWALLWIADQWCREATQPLLIAKLYRWSIEGLFISSLVYAIVVRILFLTDESWRKLMAGVIAAAACLIVGWWLGARSKCFRNCLSATAVLILMAAVGMAFFRGDYLFLWWATWSYGAASLIMSGLLMLTAVTILFFHDGGWKQKITRLAAAYLPLVMLSVFAVCLWTAKAEWLGQTSEAESQVASKKEIPDAEKLKSIREVATEALRSSRFHAISTLHAMTLAFIVMGALAFVAVVWYGAVRATARYHRFNAGNSVRFFLCVGGIVFPLLLFGVGCIVLTEGVWQLPVVDGDWQTRFDQQGKLLGKIRTVVATDDNIGQLTRLLLMFLIPVGVVVSDIVGDVIFFVAVQPWRNAEAGTAEMYIYENENLVLNPEFAGSEAQPIVAGGRFAAVVMSLSDNGRNTVVVVAHSQGSVIALREIQRMPQGVRDNLRFLTIGSPIHTLYAPFFGLFDKIDKDLVPRHWINLYRRGDYIGGSIDFRDLKQALLASMTPKDLFSAQPKIEDRAMKVEDELHHGHVNYWFEEQLHKDIDTLREMKRPVPPPTQSGFDVHAWAEEHRRSWDT